MSEIITKISEDEYRVGTYTITRQDDMWLLVSSKVGNSKALYFDRERALHTALIMYTCGQLVADGMREVLEIIVKERHPEWEELEK